MRPTLAVLALVLSTAALAKPPAEPAYTLGGTAGIVRAKYTIVPTTADARGIPAVVLPRPATVYVLPLRASVFSEAPSDFMYHPEDDTIEILAAGLYQISARVDWVGRDGSDCYPRKVMIQQLLPGENLGNKWECVTADGYIEACTDPKLGMLNVHAKDSAFFRLDGADIAGSCAVQASTGLVGRGSKDGWASVNTALEELRPGDRIFATISSDASLAKVQATNMTSLQITRWALSDQAPERKKR